MRVALVIPHIFMHQVILPDVIFSPGELALTLAHQLAKLGHEVTLFTPGPVTNFIADKRIKNLTADLSLFELELTQRDDNYIELLKKHPLIFITLARQVQSELIAQAYQLANQDQFDLVHIWCNEEEQALVTAQFCHQPVVFNHHEPFNFLTRYRAIFPKYFHLNWISFSQAQRKNFSALTHQKINWVGNVYHGLPVDQYQLETQPKNYLLYLGRIIQPKGVHYAIACAKKLGMNLKIAGKHYAGYSKDSYWQKFIEPELDGQQIEYVGFVKTTQAKQELLGGALALLMPSVWQEPFGMVMIEAMACGTPVVGFDQGAIPEIVKSGKSGAIAPYQPEQKMMQNKHELKQNWPELQLNPIFKQNVSQLADKVMKVRDLDRAECRQYFVDNFSATNMAQGYADIYQQLIRA